MQNPFQLIENRLSNIESLLLDIKETESRVPEKEEILTVQEAAEFLSLSKPTIYRLIGQGEIPVMKRSKRCYFSKKELIGYIKQGRKATTQDHEEDVQNLLNNKGQNK